MQGLRAVAVLLVLAAHLGVPGLGGGFIGVDVFFVLSGFLITGLLVHEAETTGRVSLLGFYARRARRILPAATLVLVAVLGYSLLRLSPARTAQNVADALWSSAFLANVHLADSGTGYFDNSAPSLFRHYWSLSVEEQFYLVWPLLVLLLTVRLALSRRRLALVVGGVALASFALAVATTPGDPAAYYSSLARAYELAAGALLAVLLTRPLPRPRRALLALLGALVLVVATFALHDGSPFPGWRAALPVLATCALLAAGHGPGPQPSPFSRWLCHPWMQWVGAISYSLYLWHWPLYLLAPTYAGALPRPLQVLLAAALSFGLAAATHRLVEVPFLRRRIPWLITPRRTLALWPVALACVGLVALASPLASHHAQEARLASARAWQATHKVHRAGSDIGAQLDAAVRDARQGAPIPPSITLASIKDDVWQLRHPCAALEGQTVAPPCVLGDRHARRTVALAGDSHAGQWLGAMDVLGRRHHFRVVPVLKVSCTPYGVPQKLENVTPRECDRFRTWSRRRLTALRPEAVVLGSRAMLDVVPPPGVTPERAWADGVRRTLPWFHRLTQHLVVLGDLPNRAVNPYLCLPDPASTQRTCLAPESGPEIDSNATTERLVRADGDRWAATAPLVCSHGSCPAVADGKPVYWDNSHVTDTWSKHVASALGERLAAADPFFRAR